MNGFASITVITLSGWLMTGSGLSLSSPPLYLAPQFLNDSMAGGRTAAILSQKDALLVATNQQRARKGLAVLKPDAKLMQAAQDYAELMAAKDQMSHTVNGLSLPEKAHRVGYTYRQLSENIALNSRLDGRSVVIDQWMQSKGHRKNLLTSAITDIGIGIAGPSKQNRYYYCQLFGVRL